MKRISLILLLISAILFSNAQQVVPDIRKNKGKNKTKTEQQQTGKDNADKSAPDDMHTVPALNPSGNGGAATSDAEYALLRQAIDNAFLVVKASYNVRDKESGSNVTGTEFFSTVYCVIPLLSYGFGVDNRFLKPWKSDPQYDANKYGDDLVSVDKLEYKKLKDAVFVPYQLNKNAGEALAPGFFHVADTTFHNQGLRVEIGNGAKTGYMVWFYMDPETKDVRYNVVPANVTFNENSIFNVRQPANSETVIGGAFLNLNADEPGCLRLNLMGVARLDPYGGKKWELVKLQSLPLPPVKAKPAEPVKHSKEEAKPATGTQDESIIPDQSKTKTSNKDNKKKAEKDNNKSKNTKSGKKSDKSSGTSTKA
ncbi:MAG: hypothetical protein IKZ56_08660 [Bacteroidales bacterium]|nr:hypothetical protein [Bacteroidales bacterium]